MRPELDSDAAHVRERAQRGNRRNARPVLETMRLTDGTVHRLPASGVTLVVGTNNAGKTTLLKQLVSAAGGNSSFLSPAEASPMIEALTFSLKGSEDDLLAYMLHTFRLSDGLPSLPDPTIAFQRGLHTISVERAIGAWKDAEVSHLGGLGPLLVSGQIDASPYVLTSEMRGGSGPIETPLHVLEEDPRLMRHISSLFERVFGQPLTLDTTEQQYRLRLGRVSLRPPKHGSSKTAYSRALQALTPLESQGAGMIGFMSNLLPILTETYPIYLIDEPERSLHPPQAFALGRELGQLTTKSRGQLIVATHDRYFINGLLSTRAPMSVLRIVRQDNQMRTTHLDSAALKHITSRPTLAHGNVLDSLFHSVVVLVEGDQDCIFLRAALDAAAEDDRHAIPANEILVVATYGKGNMPIIVKALRALGVTVVSCPDLDVLRDDQLKRLVLAYDGLWEEFGPLFRELRRQLAKPAKVVSLRDVYADSMAIFQEALATNPDRLLDKEVAAALKGVLKLEETHWPQLKKRGLSVLDEPAKTIAQNLMSHLFTKGIVPYSVGDLESFHSRELKGWGWAEAAISAGAHKAPSIRDHLREALARRDGRS